MWFPNTAFTVTFAIIIGAFFLVPTRLLLPSGFLFPTYFRLSENQEFKRMKELPFKSLWL